MLIRPTGPRNWRLFFQSDLVVTVDGVVAKDIIEADDEAGYVVRYQRDDRGQMIVDLGRYKSERVEGAVVFTGTKKFSPDDAKATAMSKRDRRALRNLRIQGRAERAKAGAA